MAEPAPYKPAFPAGSYARIADHAFLGLLRIGVEIPSQAATGHRRGLQLLRACENMVNDANR